jgi:hypothetical protein
MDDDDKDKNVIEKLVDKINDAVENITTTVSDAVQHAMEPDPVRPSEQPVAYMPMAGDGLLADPMMPPFVVIPRRKKATSKNAPKESGKKAAKKTVKKSAKKAAKKLSAQKRRRPRKRGNPQPDGNLSEGKRPLRRLQRKRRR